MVLSRPVMDPTSIPLSATADALPEFWSQTVVGEANGSLFRVAKGTGVTEWHSHADQDEVFVVTRGELIIELRSGDVRVGEGELFIVPRDVEHRPRAEAEAHFLIVGRTVTSNAEGGKPSWSASGGTPPAS